MRSGPENPSHAAWHAGLTALQSVAPASRHCLLSGLSPVLTDGELRTVGVNYRGENPKSSGDPNEKAHPVVNMASAACMHAKCMQKIHSILPASYSSPVPLAFPI